MDRRDSLRVMGAAICAAGIARSSDAGASTTNVDAKLKHDVDALAPRVYSDEGIPVLLACVDLHPVAGKAPALTPFNGALSREMRDNAAAWERLYPDAKPEDVSKLIEVLAQRDFAARLAKVRS